MISDQISMELNQDTQFSNGTVFDTNSYHQSKRTYLDPIHTYIQFDKSIWDIIDTVQFQRLREIKQLGLGYLVFGGGMHSRFEHSLGTAYLAQKYVKNIFKAQPFLVQGEFLKNKIKNNVLIAGLCHDLGHGPYSHLFEAAIKQVNIEQQLNLGDWSHEQASIMLFDYLIEQNNIDLQKDDQEMIKDLITGYNPQQLQQQKQYEEYRWIFDIVANKRNSIDVDKFDYLTRDSYHLGLSGMNFDYKYIMKESRVIDDEICFPAKLSHKIYELFQTRYKMYKGIYLNRVVQGIDLMLIQVFKNANNVYKFHESIYDPEKYYKLTDSIEQKIFYSKKPQLQKSQEILLRIKNRDLYKYVSETLLQTNTNLPSDEQIKQDIISFCNTDYEKVNIDDIHLMQGIINYGHKDLNPVNYVKFYKKRDFTKSYYQLEDQVSLLLPQKFSEKYLRVYCSDKNKMEIVKAAFKKYCKHKLGTNAILYECEDINQVQMLISQSKKENNLNNFIFNNQQIQCKIIESSPCKKVKK